MGSEGHEHCAMMGADPEVPGFLSSSTEVGGALVFFLIVGLLFARGLGTARGVPAGASWRVDLLRFSWLRSAVRSKRFSFWLRLFPALLFLLVIATGLFGNPRGNLAASFTWLFWWTALIFLVAFGGKIFCAVCPWDFFANLFQYGWVHGVQKKAQSLNRKWPKALSNISVATAFFIVLTWLELGFDITRNSYVTAVLGLMVLGIAVLSALVFEKRAFCRYACPVGRISGLYSQFSPLELRTRDPEACKTCVTKDCVKGGEYSTPCPTGQIPFKMDQSTYCTLCTECVRSCKKDNLTVKLRPFGVDLKNVGSSRPDESLLTVIMLALTFFHGLTMTQTWFDWTGALEAAAGLTYLQAFTALMGVMLIGTYLFFRTADRVIRGGSGKALLLAFAFIPLTLGYHLGHNSMHLFGEITYLVPLLNDPFGWGWNLMGLEDFEPSPLMSAQTLKYLQLLAIGVGFYFSVKILRIRTSQVVDGAPNIKRAAVRVFAGNYFMLFALAGLALWFVYQPMVMRSGI